MDDRELSALAAACQKGDERSFRILVDSLTRSLIAVAYRYTGDWEWARDLTQETWIKVHDGIGRFDPAHSFRAWLYAIHRNGCLSHLRRAWIRHESNPGDDVLSKLRLVSSSMDPEEEVERREFHRRLLQGLGALSESQRQVFVRVDLEGGNQKEVARALGMKPTTCRATLHFARKRLATILRRMEEGGDQED
ncbi:MAG: RNA polymerase sigma factor [Gemmatimonadota bacterium]|nr:MAG: RNA polymerase sigma factor [Gemmatimonadota bacterium]